MLDIKVNTKEFNKQLTEYLRFNKRALSEIVNTKAYYIARNAVALTASSDKEKIREELTKPSRNYPRAPLAAIICAIQNGKEHRQRTSKKTGKRLKDKTGLFGSRMTAAVNKLIRIKQATRNFLRAGWIPAIKALEPFIDRKGGPSYKKPIIKGQPKGGGKGAPKSGGWRVKSEIWNSVIGSMKKHGLNKELKPEQVQKVLNAGLQKAIDKETASMREYVEKKLQKGVQATDRFR